MENIKLTKKNIIFNEKIKTKEELFKLLAKSAKELGIVKSAKPLVEGFWEREKEGSTGMEHGIAIPHAKIDEISEPTIIFVRTKNGINDYSTLDNTKVKNIIALLIPKKDVNKKQIRILSSIALKLNDEIFRKQLNNANENGVLKLLNSINFEPKNTNKKMKKRNTKNLKIVGVTSCAAGVAHTYIARDNLINQGEKLGYNVHIETQGATGPENELTKKQIKEADIIIIASDINVNMDRFVGKKLHYSSIHPAVKDAKKLIEKSIANARVYNDVNLNSKDEIGISGVPNKGKFLKHIMNGVSWMIPLLVAAAILIAIPSIAGAIVGKSEIVTSGDWKKMVSNGLDSSIWKFMYLLIKIGWTTISLMFPIFAAFTAYSIGNKPAFIPGLIGGFLAKPSLLFEGAYSAWFKTGYPFLDKNSGFWGALIIGLVIGYIMKWSNQYIKVHSRIQAIKPMFILPMIGILSTTILMVLIINPAFGLLNDQLITLAKKSGKSGKYVTSLLIAPMTASDLGGPINKAAVTVNYSFYDDKVMSLTMRVIPTITPSIGLGLAALTDRFIVRKRVFDDDVRKAAPNAILLALLGISEGGLPFLFRRPLITMPINMFGGLIGALVGLATNTEQWFPDSAIWAWPFAKPFWGLLLGILSGSLSTMFMHIYFRLFLMKMGKIKIDAQYNRKLDTKVIEKA